MWPILITAVLATASDRVEVRTLDGRALAGELVELSPQKVVVRTGDGRQSARIDELMSITAGAAEADSNPPGVWIELIDGSQLAASNLAITRRTAEAEQPSGEAVSIPTRMLRAVRFQAETPAIKRQWAELVGSDAAADQIVIRKSDRTIDSLEGIIRDVTAENVQFDIDGDVVPVSRERVYGLIYYQPLSGKLPEPACLVEQRWGQKIWARSVAWGDGKLNIVTPAGLELSRPLDAIRLDYSAGKLQYVSDLEPESVDWTPLIAAGQPTPELETWYRPRPDQSALGGPLRVIDAESGERTFDKGLAVHGRTRIVYRLPGEFRSLQGLAATDPRAAPAGVKLVIHGDDKKLFDEPIGGPESVPLELDVRGVRRLTILVDFDDPRQLGAHVNLCDFKLVK